MPIITISRKEEIIHTSIRLIAGKGIQSLTIKNIAGEIGITEPALYKHFKGKAEIISAVLDKFDQFSLQLLKTTISEDSNPSNRIGSFLKAKYKHFSMYPELAKIMFSEALFQNDPVMQAKLLSLMHQIKLEMDNILSSGQQTGHIRKDIASKELFRIIFGSMRLLVTQWGLTGYMFDLESEGELLWKSIHNMIELK